MNGIFFLKEREKNEQWWFNGSSVFKFKSNSISTTVYYKVLCDLLKSYKTMVSEAHLNAWYMSYNKINDFYDQPIKACKGH